MSILDDPSSACRSAHEDMLDAIRYGLSSNLGLPIDFYTPTPKLNWKEKLRKEVNDYLK